MSTRTFLDTKISVQVIREVPSFCGFPWASSCFSHSGKGLIPIFLNPTRSHLASIHSLATSTHIQLIFLLNNGMQICQWPVPIPMPNASEFQVCYGLLWLGRQSPKTSPESINHYSQPLSQDCSGTQPCLHSSILGWMYSTSRSALPSRRVTLFFHCKTETRTMLTLRLRQDCSFVYQYSENLDVKKEKKRGGAVSVKEWSKVLTHVGIVPKMSADQQSTYTIWMAPDVLSTGIWPYCSERSL